MSTELLDKALSIKKRFLRMYKAANAGHIGCSLSSAEMLTFLRFNWMSEGDEFVLSKGHAAALLYSVWAEHGIISEQEIDTFYKNNTFLAAHPPANKIKGIPFATGSLGHGLSLAAGLGLGFKLRKENNQVFCITSDGEINEGSTWEAAMFITHHNLKNVIWLIDRNQLQGFGRTEEVIKLNPLDKKLEAFGFNVVEVDGHDFNELSKIKKQHQGTTKPIAAICNTVKGNGLDFFSNTVACHYLPMNEEQYNTSLQSVTEYYQERLAGQGI